MERGFGDPQGARMVMDTTRWGMTPAGEDANPLNRRLPAEVITRQRQVKKAPIQDTEDVKVDLKTATELKPDTRPRWLQRAFKMAVEGRASKTELYDILTSRKFGNVGPKNGRKLHAIAVESAHIFSDKQQRHLRTEEWVLAKFANEEKAMEREESDAEDDEPPPPPPEPTRKEEKKAKSKVEEKAPEPPKKSRRDLTGIFQDKEGREELAKMGSSWTTMAAGNVGRLQEEARKAKEDKAARKDRKEAQLENNFLKLAAEKQLENSAKQRKAEEMADSSLDLLERMQQQREEAHAKQDSPDDRKPKRNASRERGRDRERGRRRGYSRSRSVSVKAASRSRSRRRGRGRNADTSGKSHEQLLKERMAQRNREIDSSRIPVVDPGHAASYNRY